MHEYMNVPLTDLYETAKPVINACGIYFLFKNGGLVYVGQSINIISRIGQHLDSKDFDSFSFINVPRQHLNEVELHYIRKHRPPLNLTMPIEVVETLIQEKETMHDALIKIEKRLQQIEAGKTVVARTPRPSDSQGLLNEQEACEYIGMSVHWMRRMRWAGGGPEFRKIGKAAVRYHIDALNKYLEDTKRKSTSDPGTIRQSK